MVLPLCLCTNALLSLIAFSIVPKIISCCFFLWLFKVRLLVLSSCCQCRISGCYKLIFVTVILSRRRFQVAAVKPCGNSGCCPVQGARRNCHWCMLGVWLLYYSEGERGYAVPIFQMCLCSRRTHIMLLSSCLFSLISSDKHIRPGSGHSPTEHGGTSMFKSRFVMGRPFCPLLPPYNTSSPHPLGYYAACMLNQYFNLFWWHFCLRVNTGQLVMCTRCGFIKI